MRSFPNSWNTHLVNESFRYMQQPEPPPIYGGEISESLLFPHYSSRSYSMHNSQAGIIYRLLSLFIHGAIFLPASVPIPVLVPYWSYLACWACSLYVFHVPPAPSTHTILPGVAQRGGTFGQE